MLPTKGIPSNPVEERKCRAGCGRTESLSHVLQACPATHWSRIQRHNYIADRIRKIASKKDFVVEVEPHLRQSNGIMRKPDLIMIKERDLIICDVGVSWESFGLAAAYANKVGTYGTAEFIDAVRRKYGAEHNITVAPLILGACGTWCHLNRTVSNLLKLGAVDKATLITDTMKGGWAIHADFHRRTWSKQHPTSRRP